MRNCPVCDAKNKTILKEIRMAIPESFHLPKVYNLVKCDDCGFCYADTDASEADYDYYYSNCNTYSGKPIDSKAWQTSGERCEKLLSQYVGKNSAILDMGFGKGDILRFLRRGGTYVWLVSTHRLIA